MEINDNGIGFNLDDRTILGSGILNIKNRAALIATDCIFESKNEKGTYLKLTIPYKK